MAKPVFMFVCFQKANVPGARKALSKYNGDWIGIAQDLVLIDCESMIGNNSFAVFIFDSHDEAEKTWRLNPCFKGQDWCNGQGVTIWTNPMTSDPHKPDHPCHSMHGLVLQDVNADERGQKLTKEKNYQENSVKIMKTHGIVPAVTVSVNGAESFRKILGGEHWPIPKAFVTHMASHVQDYVTMFNTPEYTEVAKVLKEADPKRGLIGLELIK